MIKFIISAVNRNGATARFYPITQQIWFAGYQTHGGYTAPEFDKLLVTTSHDIVCFYYSASSYSIFEFQLESLKYD